ncbi:putative ribonuclease H-like domain-containing protein [Tanacetum coccineum]
MNIIDHLGKFDGKSDKGFLAGYSLNSKDFRVYNLETKRVEENLHITLLENKPNVVGKGPNWLFDLDYLTDSMNYQPVRSENQANKHAGPKEANHSAGTQDNIDAGNSKTEAGSAQDYFVLPIWSSYTSTVKSSEAKNEGEKSTKNTDLKTTEKPVDQEDQAFLDELERLKRQEKEANDAAEALRKVFAQDTEDLLLQVRAARASSTNIVNTASTPVSTTSYFGGLSYTDLTNTNQDDSQIPALEDSYDNPNDGIFTNASYDDEGAVADFTNLETIVNILVDLPYGKKAIGSKWVYRNKKDERGVVVRNKARLVAQGHRQEEGIDCDEVFAHVARMKPLGSFWPLLLIWDSFIMSDSDEFRGSHTEISSHMRTFRILVHLEPMDYEFPEPLHARGPPYAEDASPIAQSPDYVPESDPEADPEEDGDEDPEEDPIDYPADGGDDGDDEMDIEEDEDDDMDIEADEEDEDDEMDVEIDEEEHLAPAYPVVVALPATAPSAEETEPFETDESAATPPPHPAYRMTARISIPEPLPVPAWSDSEVARLLAISSPPASPLSPWSSSPPQIPFPLSPPSPVLTAPPPSPIRSLGYRAATIRMRAEDAPPPLPTSAPTSFPPLLLPTDSHREGRPEVNLPPRMGLGIALGPGYEVGESSAAAAARPAGGLRADYGFVATMDRLIRRDPERYVGYGITDSWEEMVETLPGAPVSTDTELGCTMRRVETMLGGYR